MLGSVFLKSLRDLRRALAWWSAGMVALVAIEIAVYPTVRDNPQLNELVENYPEALKAFIAFGGQIDYVSPAGYLGTELFSFMIPLLFLIAVVGSGASAIGGEEERGTLDLLLSAPVSRRRIALEKLAAMVAELAALGLVLWVALAVGARITSMDISAWYLGAATLSAALLALAYGSIAFMLGCATGRKGLAVGVAVATAVAGYLVNSLAALVGWLERLQKLSPFYHYAVADPLRQGVAAGRMTLFVAIALVASTVGVVAFDRRDITT